MPIQGFSRSKQYSRERISSPFIQNDGLELLDNGEPEEDADKEEKEVLPITAPLLGHDAAIQAEEGALPQYGVFGQILRVSGRGFFSKPEDQRLYCNINSPFTAIVCGVQGAGKSHTVSVLLEGMLIQDTRLGLLPSTLSAVVLHFGESGSTLKPCEATFVGQCESPLVTPPEILVFCSPSNSVAVSRSYAQFGGGAKVYPLYFLEEDVDASSLLSLMAVSENGNMPLYMHMVMTVLADMGDTYSYTSFKGRLKHLQLEPIQERMLNQRLSLLENFLCKKVDGKLLSIKTEALIQQPLEGRFKKGQLTIVDLTDPFISPSSACSLFEIVLKLFNKAELNCGKVVVLDEAHKYLSTEGIQATEGSKRLTERLLSFTRQQRHLAMRVIISTQEPTVVPSSIIDLASFVVCHRFFSAGWFHHLAKHISSELDAEAFEKVVTLDRGECLIFSPEALFIKQTERQIQLNLSQQELPQHGGGFQGEPEWGVVPETTSKTRATEPDWGVPTGQTSYGTWGDNVEATTATNGNAQPDWGTTPDPAQSTKTVYKKENPNYDSEGKRGQDSGWGVRASATSFQPAEPASSSSWGQTTDKANGWRGRDEGNGYSSNEQETNGHDAGWGGPSNQAGEGRPPSPPPTEPPHPPPSPPPSPPPPPPPANGTDKEWGLAFSQTTEKQPVQAAKTNGHHPIGRIDDQSESPSDPESENNEGGGWNAPPPSAPPPAHQSASLDKATQDVEDMCISEVGDDADVEVAVLGRGYLIVRTRKRITDDGGRSIMAFDPNAT